MGGAASAQAQAPPHMETPAPPFPPARLAEKGPPVGGLRSMKRLRRLLYIKAYNAKPEGTTIDELFRRYRRVNAAGVGRAGAGLAVQGRGAGLAVQGAAVAEAPARPRTPPASPGAPAPPARQGRALCASAAVAVVAAAAGDGGGAGAPSPSPGPVAEAPSPVVAEAPSPVVAASPAPRRPRRDLDELEPVDECALAVLPGDAVIAAGDHLQFRRPGPAKPLWRKREVVLQERIVQYTTVDVSGAVQELVETERSSTEVVHMECKETGEFAHRETSEYEQLETFNGQAVAENRGNQEYYHLKSAEDEVEFMESNNMPNRAGAPGDAPPGTPGGAPGGRPRSRRPLPTRAARRARAVYADTGLPLSPEDFDIFQRAAFAQREAYAAYAAGGTRSSRPTRASSQATSARRRRRGEPGRRRGRRAGPVPRRARPRPGAGQRRRPRVAEFGFGGDEPPRFAGDLDDVFGAPPARPRAPPRRAAPPDPDDYLDDASFAGYARPGAGFDGGGDGVFRATAAPAPLSTPVDADLD
ncbi:hypothetical protein JL721_8028 [Aureococcus anophagefferens]|nr:hypothetical protein JL721_8028 [Aureococcus anophagefferens]